MSKAKGKKKILEPFTKVKFRCDKEPLKEGEVEEMEVGVICRSVMMSIKIEEAKGKGPSWKTRKGYRVQLPPLDCKDKYNFSSRLVRIQDILPEQIVETIEVLDPNDLALKDPDTTPGGALARVVLLQKMLEEHHVVSFAVIAGGLREEGKKLVGYSLLVPKGGSYPGPRILVEIDSENRYQYGNAVRVEDIDWGTVSPLESVAEKLTSDNALARASAFNEEIGACKLVEFEFERASRSILKGVARIERTLKRLQVKKSLFGKKLPAGHPRRKKLCEEIDKLDLEKEVKNLEALKKKCKVLEKKVEECLFDKLET